MALEEEMIIIAGRSHPELAEKIATKLTAPLIKADTKKFADQELKIQINTQLHGEKVVIVQSTSNPANDNLMELLFLVDIAKSAGSNNIIAVIPYFGYSRQDRSTGSNDSISASLVARLLETSGANMVITLDLHSQKIEKFFKILVQNLDPTSLFAEIFKDTENAIIVSPDVGGVARARKLADRLELELAVIDKKRLPSGDCTMSKVVGEVQGKDCIIIDDILDTGKTLAKAYELLIEQGAKSVSVCITHPVFSRDSLELIEKIPFAKIYVTNSIKQSDLPSKIQVIQIADILANALLRL